MFTFVTGGLRSGKSGYALSRASELGPPPWVYVAPSVEGDDELKGRLANHRRDHEASWKLLEAPAELPTIVDAIKGGGYGAMVIDRFTAWVQARIAGSDRAAERALLAEVEELADRLYRSPTPAVLVTMEIGLGHLSEGDPARRFISAVGQANQILVERAQSVVLMVSGVPLRMR
ncbi:MAG TPA: bifunctional adenosylcobinamide kinase/adenosylcobinamide-phosphate guanylyltransferase [Polyangia bacterium]|jgi:adenosylcobinamide kinase/adenosylcobinamide-phosphate guanylyltransferase|nr:bifunctional adenosylcobinamide kinase/adenosylcobinamide-phosphate guanylyltransferase [Polyangia bacterium]